MIFLKIFFFFPLLDSSLGLSVTDTSILTLLKKDVYYEVINVRSAPSTALQQSQSGCGATSLSLVCAGDGTCVTDQQIKIYLGREGASFSLLCGGVEVRESSYQMSPATSGNK